MNEFHGDENEIWWDNYHDKYEQEELQADDWSQE